MRISHIGIVISPYAKGPYKGVPPRKVLLRGVVQRSCTGRPTWHIPAPQGVAARIDGPRLPGTPYAPSSTGPCVAGRFARPPWVAAHTCVARPPARVVRPPRPGRPAQRVQGGRTRRCRGLAAPSPGTWGSAHGSPTCCTHRPRSVQGRSGRAVHAHPFIARPVIRSDASRQA